MNHLNCCMEKNRMKIISLDGNELNNRERAHEYLQEMLGFPDYYGRNLDALFDCLTELDETEVIIEQGDVYSQYLERILEVFHEAAEENEELKVTII